MSARKNKTNGTEVQEVNRVAAVIPEPEQGGIMLPKLDMRMITIRVVGDSPLITHAWSEKAKAMMRDKQTGKATKGGREIKNPIDCMEQAMYRTHDGKPGIPALSFKNAAVTACTSLGKAISKVAARQAFHVMGDILPIEGEPVMDESMVRVGMGVADIRYRPRFDKWAVNVYVRYNARVISAEQLINLFNIAGFAVGVCEWRPECNGQMGMFHVTEFAGE